MNMTEDTKNRIVHADHKDAGAALLIVDLVTDFDFENGKLLFEAVQPKIDPIVGLKARMKKAEMPVIYVNDNFGIWKNSFSKTLEAARSSVLGKQVVSRLLPDDDDYHVLKPQRSGFFATPLDVLLSSLEVSELVIVGVTTDICVLFTAHDAYMRGYRVKVPSDCSAAVEEKHHSQSLKLLERIADADTRPSTEIDLEQLG